MTEPDWLTGLWGATVAWMTGLWGAVVAYARTRSDANPWALLSFGVHLCVNGFVTWLSWLVCVSQGIDGAQAAILSGLAGYLGVETLKPAEAQIAGLWARVFSK